MATNIIRDHEREAEDDECTSKIIQVETQYEWSSGSIQIEVDSVGDIKIRSGGKSDGPCHVNRKCERGWWTTLNRDDALVVVRELLSALRESDARRN